jgi:predicted MFS family arabinose efflux permease
MVCGYFLIGFATHQALALIGAFIAGAGYALVYPSITRESLSRVPDRNRGAVMAVTSSAATLSLGLGGPFMGLLAEAAGTASVFVFAGAMAICAMVVVAMMRPAPKP